jgi:hypothetical protein
MEMHRSKANLDMSGSHALAQAGGAGDQQTKATSQSSTIQPLTQISAVVISWPTAIMVAIEEP